MEGGPDPTLAIANVHGARRIDEEALERLIRLVIAGEDCELRSLSVVLADQAQVHALNRAHLGHDYPTDVLSFPLTDEQQVIDGEIYIDLDTAAERHEEFRASFDEEVRRYVIHGVLHLAGYDDSSPETRAAMRAREDHYLRQDH